MYVCVYHCKKQKSDKKWWNQIVYKGQSLKLKLA